MTHGSRVLLSTNHQDPQANTFILPLMWWSKLLGIFDISQILVKEKKTSSHQQNMATQKK